MSIGLNWHKTATHTKPTHARSSSSCRRPGAGRAADLETGTTISSVKCYDKVLTRLLLRFDIIQVNAAPSTQSSSVPSLPVQAIYAFVVRLHKVLDSLFLIIKNFLNKIYVP